MSIRDILVYLDPSSGTDARLDFAFRLAHRFEAYVLGIVPKTRPPSASGSRPC